MVHVPTVEQEDQRQLHRELIKLKADQTAEQANGGRNASRLRRLRLRARVRLGRGLRAGLGLGLGSWRAETVERKGTPTLWYLGNVGGYPSPHALDGGHEQSRGGLGGGLSWKLPIGMMMRWS